MDRTAWFPFHRWATRKGRLEDLFGDHRNHIDNHPDLFPTNMRHSRGPPDFLLLDNPHHEFTLMGLIHFFQQPCDTQEGLLNSFFFVETANCAGLLGI